MAVVLQWLVLQKSVDVDSSTTFTCTKCSVFCSDFPKSMEASAPLVRKLNILSVYDINIHQISVFIYKYMFLPSSLPSSFSNFFKSNSQIHSHNTRQVNYLHLSFYKTKHGQHSLRYRGVQIWNTKIHVIKSSLSLEHFKRKLSSHLIHDV